LSQGFRRGTPTPVFFFKSAELHENKRVDFFGSAKKVQKSAQGFERKGIVVSEEWVAKKEIPPKTPITCIIFKRKDLQDGQFVND